MQDSIDVLDALIVRLLIERIYFLQENTVHKKKYNLSRENLAPETEQMTHLRRAAEIVELDPSSVEEFLGFIIREVVRQHGTVSSDRLHDQPQAPLLSQPASSSSPAAVRGRRSTLFTGWSAYLKSKRSYLTALLLRRRGTVSDVVATDRSLGLPLGGLALVEARLREATERADIVSMQLDEVGFRLEQLNRIARSIEQRQGQARQGQDESLLRPEAGA